MYSLLMVPLTGLLKHLAESHTERAEARGQAPARSAALIPSIANYICGWGFANAAVRPTFVRRLRQSRSRRCDSSQVALLDELQLSEHCRAAPRRCLGLNVGYACGWTGVAAVLGKLPSSRNARGGFFQTGGSSQPKALISVVKPYVREIECGSGAVADRRERLCGGLSRVYSRG